MNKELIEKIAQEILSANFPHNAKKCWEMANTYGQKGAIAEAKAALSAIKEAGYAVVESIPNNPKHEEIAQDQLLSYQEYCGLYQAMLKAAEGDNE